MKSQKGNIKTVPTILSGVYTSSQTGQAVDLTGYDAAMIVASFGAGGDTYDATDKARIYIEESDDGSSWNVAALEDVQNGVGGTFSSTFANIDNNSDDEKNYEAHYIGHKNFIRANASFPGTHTNGMPLAVNVVLRGKQYFPIA